MIPLKLIRRDRLALLLSAVLVGALFLPVVQMSVPALREQASAITAGALLNLDASNASSYSGSGVNWYDLSNNGAHATLVGSPTYDATNKAIIWGASNTSKHATVNGFYSGNWDNGFSVSFYADMGSAKSYARVFDFSPGADTNGSPNNINVHREGTTQNLRVTFTGATAGAEGSCKSGSIITNDSFKHYAITITNSGACTFYGNGVSISTSQMNTGSGIPNKPTTATRGSAYIARAHWPDPYPDGKLRNLAIYNFVLTSTQVTANYNSQSTLVAAQAAVTLISTSGTYGTRLRLTTTGGSGTGTVSYSTSSSGCNITNTDSLTVTSALTCSVTATKAASSGYSEVSSSATNVVFATRPITIKAAAKSATYTGSSVSVSNSYSITSGTLAGSDTFTALTYTYSSGGYSASQLAPINAGSYTITPSAASFSVGSANSYSITYETATLTINKADQGVLTITTTTSKYGTPVRLITSGGSGTGALSFAITSSGTASGCSITNETITVSSIGTCKVTATKALDTNYLVTSSAEATITFAKAETITVTTTLSSNSVFYNELPANVTVTQTVTGLVNSDTPTVTNSYTLNSCQSGGSCVVGDISPGGGYVFYVSATPINIVAGISTGGIYLATAPQTWSGAAADPTAGWGCNGTDISGTSEAVGSGAQNTWLNTVGCATAGRASRLAADSSAEGFTDWFMPSIGELNLIYNNLKLSNLSDLNGSSYWSSTQNASNPASSATYRAFSGSGAATADKDSMFSVRPIRAFSPGAGASNTLPTDVGTYSVTPTLTLSSPASLSNYQAVKYFGTTLTINRARQRALSVGQYNAFPGMSTYPLNVYGGSGPGLVTRSLISGGSAGCSIAQDLLITAINVGTCDVRVEKAGTPNYFSESTTATIYWIQWSDAYATRAPSTPTEIVLNHQTAITKYNYETLTVTSYQNSSGVTITSIAIGATMRIMGDGFSLTSDYTEVVFASMDMVDLTSGLQVISSGGSNYLQLTVPSGVTTGAITVNSPKGMAVGPTLTITP